MTLRKCAGSVANAPVTAIAWRSDMAFDPVTSRAAVKTIPGELYKPSGTAATGLVVIAYGTDGWKDPWTKMMQGYAEDLAGRGLFALMPDYFARTGTKHGGAAAEIAEKQDDWTAALVDSVAFARTFRGSMRPASGCWGSRSGAISACAPCRGEAEGAGRVLRADVRRHRRTWQRPVCADPSRNQRRRRPSSRMRRRLRQYSSSKVPTSRSANTRTPRTALPARLPQTRKRPWTRRPRP